MGAAADVNDLGAAADVNDLGAAADVVSLGAVVNATRTAVHRYSKGRMQGAFASVVDAQRASRMSQTAGLRLSAGVQVALVPVALGHEAQERVRE